MLYLGLIAVATLMANSARQLRYMALAFLLVSVVANAIASSSTPLAQLALTGCAGLAAAGVLYVAARHSAYGEESGWRPWLATIVAAIVTPIAYASFRTLSGEPAALPLWDDDSGVIAQVAGVWLLSSGVAILLTARRAARASLAALVMVTGVQLLVRPTAEARLAITLMLSWLEVVIALAGAFLVVNERAVIEG
ncbi:MAG TPA: hypothetical protein VF998_07095 [Candidatus Limnocylindria bacterium]